MRKITIIIGIILVTSSISLVFTTSAATQGDLLISGVLYDTPGSDASEEWVSIYNPGSMTVDLTGWAIKDNVGTFTLSGSISPGGYVVIARSSAGFQALYGFAPDLVMGSSIQLSNSGDWVDLVDAANNLIDRVAWENKLPGWTVAAKNTAIERMDTIPVNPSSWQDTGTLGNPNANPNLGTGSGNQVLLTEVLYDTPGVDADEEWIEITNFGSALVDLTGWTISDNGGSYTLSGTIAPNEALVIARTSVGFQALYGTTPDLVMGNALAFSNSGDWVELKDNNGMTADLVAWENAMAGWSVTATNTAIERIGSVTPQDPAAWVDAGDLGTPGSLNDATGPDTIAPTISITNPTDGATVSGTVSITTSASDNVGVTATEISIDGALVASSTTYSWDTTSVVDGTHTISASAYDAAGNVGSTTITVTVNNANPPPQAGLVKVMSYNIEASGLNPDWKQVVKEENPDIAVFIETGDWDDNNNALLNQYCSEFNSYFSSVGEDPYNCVGTTGISFSTSGEAVFSRFPVLSVTQIPTVTLDDGTQYSVSHDFLDVQIDVSGTAIHVIAAHLKCCSGTTNEDKREKQQEGIINYIDNLGDVPVIYAGDLNSFSPEDTQNKGNLNYGPMSIVLKDNTYGNYAPRGSVLHTFVDVHTTLNPGVWAPTYGHTNPLYESRIDFITVNQFFTGKLVSSTTGDTPTANTGSDHYSVDVTIDFGGTADTTPPAQVTGVVATPNTSQIDLTWNANTEPDLASYNVYRDGALLATVTSTSYTDTAISVGVTYTYTVSAVDTSGNEGMQSTAVTASVVDTIPPAQVTGLTASVVGYQVDLSWSANTESDLASYNVYRDGTLLATVSTNSYTDASVAIGTTYTYSVSAVDTSGNEGQQSAAASVTITDTTPPSQVTGLVATATGGTTINLSWNAASDNVGVTSYNIYRDGVLVATTTGTSYTDSGLVSETTYTYTVSALDTAGNEGPQSAVATATTLDITPPAQVTGLTVIDVTDTTVTLSWTGSNAPDLAYYKIYRDGVFIATTTTTSFTDTGLTGNTAYSYAISAVDTSGNEGLQSTAVTAITANPPAGLGYIIISEVYYDAVGRDADREWVELYNPTGQTVDLTGYYLTDATGRKFQLSGTIAPGQYLIVARSKAGFSAFYGFAADLGNLNFALNNKGDLLRLYNGQNLVDEVAWENKIAGWNIYASTGQSIARADVSVDTDSVSDWIIVGNNGTPGSA